MSYFYTLLMSLFFSITSNSTLLSNYTQSSRLKNYLQSDSSDKDTTKIHPETRTNKTTINVPTIDRIISVLSILATIISVIIVIVQARQLRLLRKQKHRLSWDDIEVGINKLFQKIDRDYKPELVIALSERGTAIVTMGFAVFGSNLPIFTGFWQNPGKEFVNLSEAEFIELVSRGRKFYLPNSILKFKDKKLLIIDDWSFSGQAMNGVYELLKSNGIPDDNIRCAALVATSSAKAVGKPDPNKFYFYYEFPDNDFYFPWGKAT